MNRKLICISGGIGSGKSVVCHILSAMGYEIYDCDSRARSIMDRDTEIHSRLVDEIHPMAVREGVIDRKIVSEIVFSDASKLERLNRIVHHAVRRDMLRWIDEHIALGTKMPLFVETAILYQSGLNEVVDEVWVVTAPEELRIARVMNRNGLTADQVRLRIESQRFEPAADAVRPLTIEIVNDGHTPVLPQVLELLG